MQYASKKTQLPIPDRSVQYVHRQLMEEVYRRPTCSYSCHNLNHLKIDVQFRHLAKQPSDFSSNSVKDAHHFKSSLVKCCHHYSRLSSKSMSITTKFRLERKKKNPQKCTLSSQHTCAKGQG